jgi:integrase
LTFKQLDTTLLSKYETHLRSIGNKNGGIGLKMREIRALYNDAIKKGIAKQENYPFRDYKIGQFKSKGAKQALLIKEMKQFLDFDFQKYPHLINAYHYFIFSYYAGGMNFQDLMLLKWKNIIGDRIQYTRSKTKKTFNISITEPMREIINYYKNLNSSYIFPIILQDNLSPQQIANRKHKVLSRYNIQLKEIAKIQKIEKNITSYVARHSFATNLKFMDVSTDKISQLMGHSDMKVTQHYLNEFGDDVLDEAVKKLIQEPQQLYA